MNSRLARSLDNFNFIAENAPFDPDPDIADLAIAKDDAVFHFAFLDDRVVAYGCKGTDVAFFDHAVFSDNGRTAYDAVNDLRPLFYDDFSSNARFCIHRSMV